MWKACYNIIHTRLNLVQRKVIDKAEFLICGAEKFILHVLWECLATIDVWREGNYPLRKWALVT